MKNLSVLLVIFLLSACSSAQQSSQINKAYVSSAKYKSFTCEELIREV